MARILLRDGETDLESVARLECRLEGTTPSAPVTCVVSEQVDPAFWRERYHRASRWIERRGLDLPGIQAVLANPAFRRFEIKNGAVVCGYAELEVSDLRRVRLLFFECETALQADALRALSIRAATLGAELVEIEIVTLDPDRDLPPYFEAGFYPLTISVRER